MKTVKRFTSAALAALLLIMAAACNGGGGSSSSSSRRTASDTSEAAGSNTDSAAGSQSAADSSGAASTASKPGTTSGKTTASTTVKPPAQTLTITLGSVWGNAQLNLPAGTSAYSDAFKKKFTEIKNKYNVQINVENVATNSIDIIQRAIQAGDTPYDIMELPMQYVRNLGMSGALYDQKTIKTLNLNAAQFAKNKALFENVSFKGKIYGTNFGFHMNAFNGIFANRDLLSKYGQPDVVTLFKNNQWTFAKFREICKAVSRNTGGDSANDIWGVASEGRMLGVTLTSNSGATVSRDASGKYVVNMTSQKGIAAYEWIRELYHTDQSFYRTADINATFKMFQDEKAAFIVAWLGEIVTFANDCDFDMAFIPFPKGDQPDYKIGGYNAQYFCMPKNLKNADLIGQVYAELSTVDIDGIYRKQFTDMGFDKTNTDVIMSLSKYLSPEFIGGVDYSAFGAKMTNSVFSQNGSPSNVLNSVKTQFDKAVSDYYSTVK